MEEWRPVPVEEFSSYEVSSMGAVRHNGRMLKQSLSRGYYAVVLCNKWDVPVTEEGLLSCIEEFVRMKEVV